ncbi:hypothetical protein KSP40_PGU004799 [Platanthera guangdongensis]|uniref:Uncharacterized protein n=1 Tax=Platanthera guangdongensis TaxID=2320717 RepID=A0ABR2MZP2_9ASPA
MEVMTRSKVTNSRNGPKRCMSRREKKIALEQDVDKLRNKLRHEENVHRALERAFTRPLGALPRLPSYLPSYTLQLLAEVAVLEEEVGRLEEQVMNFWQGLYQEAIHISSSQKTPENGLELCSDRFLSLKNTYSPSINSNGSAISSSSPPMQRSIEGNPNLPSPSRLMNGNRLRKKTIFSMGEGHSGKENQLSKNSTKMLEHFPSKKASESRINSSQPVHQASHKEGVVGKACEDVNDTNKLSEEILRCLLNIFIRASVPKNTMAVETETGPSESDPCDTDQDAGTQDPYHICTQFGRRDIGPYKHLYEVDESSIDACRISKFSFQTLRLKLLFRKLASVNISDLTHQQKLAFWINIYNSCMMNAFLENDIPTTAEMVVSLMPKAKVNVGGQLFSAITIEHFMLRMPYNLKHISPNGLKVGQVAWSSLLGLDWPEPLVTFALSCGSWSSPAVRIYTASQVEQQLEEAKRDYLQAAVGLTNANQLAIPKLLDWFMLDFAKDMESLLDWICLQLPGEIRKDAVECLETGRRWPISRPVHVLPYEFRFRYLLAP